jgi:D-hydroxyproline dehydrogenase subunit alpha
LSEPLSAEVVVVGSGPAGIAAAAHAGESDRSVLLLDASPRPGGQIWRHHAAPPKAARPWLARLARSGARVLTQAAVVDAPVPRVLLVDLPGRAALVHYDALVLATGARELLLPFPGWTLPGVIGAGAAQALRESGARFDGLRVVVAGSGPLLIAAGAALRGAGATVAGIAEQAPWARLAGIAAAFVRQPRKLVEGAGYGVALRGAPYRAGAWVTEATGGTRLEGVHVSDGRRSWSWDCDVLACGFGLVPNLELARLLGCETDGERVATDAAQRTSVPGVLAAGELCGVAGVGQALVTGAIAGLVAAGTPVPPALLRERVRERAFAGRLQHAFSLRGELRSLARPGTIVCRCEDVTLERIASERPLGGRPAATSETACRSAKLHTRAGMGPCQGRVCGAALRFLFGWGPDTIRPPLLPAALSTLCEAVEDAPPNGTGGPRAMEEQP